MFVKDKNLQRSLEIILVIIVVALAALLFKVPSYKMAVFNLFYLPVVLAAFFLGRYRAGILALLSVIAASTVASLDLSSFAAFSSPLVIGLAITIWGAVLGLVALLVGTLGDERSAKIAELHEAYVGVVEVFSKYQQSANPKLKDRSRRVSELSQEVAQQMKLSIQEIDDVRVAALLQDMESIEITAKVIKKAIGDLSDMESDFTPHTFHGTDLVQSLGSVLRGVLPLVVSQNDLSALDVLDEKTPGASGSPMGAKVIYTVRAYDALVHESSTQFSDPQQALTLLQSDSDADHHPAVLDALQQVVNRHDAAKPLTSAQQSASAVVLTAGV
jgi:hypothetical protein